MSATTKTTRRRSTTKTTGTPKARRASFRPEPTLAEKVAPQAFPATARAVDLETASPRTRHLGHGNGHNIFARLRAMDISQVTFSRLVGVSQPAVSAWARGFRPMPLWAEREVARLEAALDAERLGGMVSASAVSACEAASEMKVRDFALHLQTCPTCILRAANAR